MRLSGGLALFGTLLLLLQVVWAPADDVPMPWHFAPLLGGIAALAVAVIFGVARGNRRYRASLFIGMIGAFLIGVSFVVPFDIGSAGPRSGPSTGEITVGIGLIVTAIALLLGASAIRQSPPVRPIANRD